MKPLIKIGFCILLLCSTLGVFAQSDSSKFSFIGVNGGIAVPLKSFAPFSSVFPDSKASLGYTVNITVEYPIKNSRIGIIGLLSYGQNKFNPISFSPSGGGYLYDSSRYGNFNELTIQGGIYLPLSSKDNVFNFHVLGGVLFFTFPETMYSENYYYPSYAYNETYRINSANIMGLTFDMGFGIKGYINQKLLFALSIDTFFSEKSNCITGLTNYQAGTNTYFSSLNVFLFNITTGLAYVIGK
jgi:hypothetical protein